jgi:addiction module HigA family antidote
MLYISSILYLNRSFDMAKTVVSVPGAVLKGLLDSYHIPVAKISEDIGLSPSAIRQLLNNKLKISIIIALKLGKYFGKKPEYWINLQTAYELDQLNKDAKVGVGLKKIALAKKLPAPAPKAKVAASKKGPKAGAKRGPKAGAKKGPKAVASRKGPKPGAKKGPKAGIKRGPKAGVKRGPKAAVKAADKKPRKPRTVKPKIAPVSPFEPVTNS